MQRDSRMKKSDSIVLTTAGIGIASGIAIFYFFPDTPWYVYVGVGVGTLLAIPKSLEDEAKQKLAKKILDEE